MAHSNHCDDKPIVLVGQDVPQGEDQHHHVFGSPQEDNYDGIHMRGLAGRNFLTRSVQKVLMKAGLIPKDKNLYTMESSGRIRKECRGNQQEEKRRTNRSSDIPHGRKESAYDDAMGTMIRRIRALSTNPKSSENNDQIDDVFSQPGGRSVREHPRDSVIREGATAMSGNILQEHYNIPVSNPFSQLLN